MNRLLRCLRLRRVENENAVAYSRYGGDVTSDEPAPTRLVVKGFNKNDSKFHFCSCSDRCLHSTRSTVYLIAIGLAGIFFCTMFARETWTWYSSSSTFDYKIASLLFLYVVIGVYIHVNAFLGLENFEATPVGIMLAAYFSTILFEGFVLSRYLCGYIHPQFMIDKLESNPFLRYSVYLYIVATFVQQFAALWSFNRCHNFLEQRAQYKVERAMAEQAKSFAPQLEVSFVNGVTTPFDQSPDHEPIQIGISPTAVRARTPNSLTAHPPSSLLQRRSPSSLPGGPSAI